MNVEKLFAEYWKDSFPTAPANKQAAASHIAFAEFILTKYKQERVSDLTEE
jgi:hypothetical protein